jgi:hypothetical protein
MNHSFLIDFVGVQADVANDEPDQPKEVADVHNDEPQLKDP